MATSNRDQLDVVQAVTSIASQIPLLDAKRAGVELYGAPRLNAFSLFSPGENAISRVAQDLLDPLGTHGQGAAFLNILLAQVGFPGVGPTEPVRVRREVQTSAKRRIDLVVESSRVLLGIENKPWASQQPDQLADYLSALRYWAGDRAVALLFLSDQQPKTAEGEVIVVPYADSGEGISLRSILADSMSAVRAPRVRMHVEEFIAFIDQHFGGDLVEDASEEPYCEAVEVEFEKPERRRAIAAILVAQHRIHSQILAEIAEFILGELGEDFEVVDELTLPDAVGERYLPWKLRKSGWPENLHVAIEAHGRGFCNVYYGIRAPAPKDKDIRSAGEGCDARPLVEPALSSVQGGRKTNWWPWWAYAWSRDWTTEFTARLVLQSGTGKVADHPQVVQLAETLVSLAACVDRSLSKR